MNTTTEQSGYIFRCDYIVGPGYVWRPVEQREIDEPLVMGMVNRALDLLTWSTASVTEGVKMARPVADPRKITHADVVSSCRFYLQVLGAWDLKVWGGPFQRDGCPDIIACLKGRFIGVECKVARDKLRPAQIREKARIEAAGGLYILAKEGGAKAVEDVLVAEGLAIPCLM